MCVVCMAADEKRIRRAGRSEAIRAFNTLAREFDVDEILSRSTGAQVRDLYVRMCTAVPGERAEELAVARRQWCDNGGEDLDEKLLPEFAASSDDDDGDLPAGQPPVEGHRYLPTPSCRAFRIKSKAFMLTFNSETFGQMNPEELFEDFRAWAVERAAMHGATSWSATAEIASRTHLHAYFSWQGPGANGIDHSSTAAWRFQDIRPRVDVNNENRGRWHWLRAVQHGHFYVSVMKEGTLHADTDYAPWTSDWVPEASWVTSLWKAHKLSHAAFLELSAKLRDGHDRRKACADAVISYESANAHAKEKMDARNRITKKAKPFKPLPDLIQRWRLQYHEDEERYNMLVLFGRSRTGKSRLCRSLFGDETTLVVDVQHAEHPDLRSLNRKKHNAVLFDEVASPKFVVSNKKVLQAHIDGAILGQSATQLYTYEVFLWKTPLMLTTNCWEYADYPEADRDWIEANCVAVHISSPVWEEPASSQLVASQGASPILPTACSLPSFSPTLPGSDASPLHKRSR